jgi:DNA-binding NtrC family response regulator
MASRLRIDAEETNGTPSALLSRLRHPKPALLRERDAERSLVEKLGVQLLVGQSRAFQVVVRQIPKIARAEANVLLLGETGTGKELCARAVHYLSARAGKPFVPVNCGAIPSELVENELFGHVPGAYTGATTTQPGLIREAEGGTLLLDEIDTLPLLVQVKLLRFLQTREYRPLGATTSKRASIRIVAATNANLTNAVRAGTFRQDLYYRLNILTLELPPLRHRPEDIPLLAHHFLQRYTVELERTIHGFSAEAMQALLAYDWPGNVRELENIVERAVVLSDQGIIQLIDLALPLPPSTQPLSMFQAAKAQAIARFEQAYLQHLLTMHRGNITHAAQAAGKHRRAFWQLLRKHGIRASDFTSSV